MASGGSTVVQYLTTETDMEGSNPAVPGTWGCIFNCMWPLYEWAVSDLGL